MEPLLGSPVDYTPSKGKMSISLAFLDDAVGIGIAFRATEGWECPFSSCNCR